MVGRAKLSDYAIRIMDRATLLPSRGAEAYGVVMDLADGELRNLYASPSVSDYQSERVEAVTLEDGVTHRCACYNLPVDKLGSGANEQYALSLAGLLRQLGFPETYAGQVMKQGGRAAH